MLCFCVYILWYVLLRIYLALEYLCTYHLVIPSRSYSQFFLNFVHFDETSINHIILQFIFRYFTQFTLCVLNPYVCYFNTKDVNFCLECFYLVFPIDDYGSKLIHSHTELI